MGREYAILQEAEYLKAVEATHGYMSIRSDISSWDVYTKPHYFQFSTDELKEHVLRFTRTTRNVFEQQWLDNYLGDKGEEDN